MAHSGTRGTIVAFPKSPAASTTCPEAWGVEQLWAASVRSRLPEQLKGPQFLATTAFLGHETPKFKFSDEGNPIFDSFAASFAVTIGDKRHRPSCVVVFSCFHALKSCRCFLRSITKGTVVAETGHASRRRRCPARHSSERKSDGGALARYRERRGARARPHRTVHCPLRQSHLPGREVC